MPGGGSVSTTAYAYRLPRQPNWQLAQYIQHSLEQHDQFTITMNLVCATL